MTPGDALWLADCAEDSAWSTHGADVLGAFEQQRYTAIQHPLRQRQFLLGRLLLRHMLSRRFDLPLNHWQFADQPQQAPQLLGVTPQPIYFSISHSRHFVACLLTGGAVAGCDIEYMSKTRNVMAIARLYFDAQDVQALAALPGAEQTQTFYRLWTQHEARYKAAVPQAVCSTALWQDYCLAVALNRPSEVSVHQANFESGALRLLPLTLNWDRPQIRSTTHADNVLLWKRTTYP